jgi:hypothetical protein
MVSPPSEFVDVAIAAGRVRSFLLLLPLFVFLSEWVSERH